MTRMISLVSGVDLLSSSVEARTERRAALRMGRRLFGVGVLGKPSLEFLRTLANEHVDREGPKAREFLDLVNRLDGFGLLDESVERNGIELFRRSPIAASPGRDVPDGRHPVRVRLSRFAQVSRDHDRVILTSAAGTSTFTISDPGLLAGLFSGITVEGNSPLADLGRLTFGAGVTVTEEDDEEIGPASLWSPHELAFHRGTRRHRAAILGDNFGASAVRPSGSEPTRPSLGLPVPLPERVGASGADDVAVAEAIHLRRSTRHYDERNPLTLAQLATLLHFVGRATEQASPLPHSPRRYPSGGALYELDIYVAVRSCTGLQPDTYLYDPLAHTLAPVNSPASTRNLLADTAQAMEGEELPQLLIVLAARFGALMTKYREIGYSLILKHVGVVMEVGYLVAAAEGLAICALGSGDPEAFAEVTGLDPLVVSSVGEIALGSPPPLEGRQR